MNISEIRNDTNTEFFKIILNIRRVFMFKQIVFSNLSKNPKFQPITQIVRKF